MEYHEYFIEILRVLQWMVPIMNLTHSHLTLRQLADIISMGVNLARIPKESEGALMVPVIHVRDIIEDALLNVDQLECVSMPDTAQYHRQLLEPGDVLVSARGTLMKCAVVPPSHRGTIASANFMTIRLGKSAVLKPELLCAFLRQPSLQHSVLGRVSSTAQAALTIRDLENLRIPIPSPDIQPLLVRFLDVSEEQFRTAVSCARLRKEEAMDVLARYMDPTYAS
ncbi:restriction endonuclease subunit S [Ensifer adhaerens]|uniref:restriction endonuclease subunit S n=1 Tax=Ensifer adhaerens TaxID=106592 RepID=UPI003D0941D1